jgi:hypothetical protein
MFWKLIHLWKILRNYLLCKLFLITGILKYPSSILPNATYVREIDINNLLIDSYFFVTRRFECLIGDLYDSELDILKSSAFILRDVPGMSMSILGAFFISEYNKFRPINEGQEIWADGSDVLLSDHINNYEIIEPFLSAYFPGNEIHDQSVPFFHSIEKQTVKLLVKDGQEPVVDKKENKYKTFGKTLLKHAPTKLNYWHVELELHDHVPSLIDRDKKLRATKNKDAAQFVIDHILTACGSVQINPEIPLIPRHCYIAN